MDTKDKILRHPRNANILFDKDAHKYTYIGGKFPEEYKGLTSLIKNCQEPFDKEGISRGVARKRGISVAEVLAEWDDATEYGNTVHDGIENLIETGEWDDEIDYELTAFSQMHTELDLTPVVCEWVIYNEDYKRASAIDGVFLDKDGKLTIVDFKTYKNFTFDPYKNKNFLFPLINVPDTKYNYTCIQIMSYDKWLREKYSDIPISDTHYIFHIRPDEYGWYPVAPMTKSVELIHKHHDLFAI